MRRSATCTPVDTRPETIALVIMRDAGWPSREATTVEPRSSCVPNAMPSRTATSGVTSTLIVPTTPSRENSDRTPRDSQTRFWRIWAPASIVLYGYTRTSGPISASSPTTHSSPRAAPSSTRTRARRSQLRPTVAPRTTAEAPMCVPPSITQRCDRRAGLDRDVRAEHRIRPDGRALLDRRVRTEARGAGDHVDAGQRHALAEPDVLLQAHARDVDADEAVEHVLVRLAVLLDRPDVLPVLVLRHDVAVQRRALGQQLGEQLLREVVGLALRDAVEQLRLDHVDAGVDRVGEDLSPRRLLEEALDAPLVVDDHDAELERVVDRLECDRRERAALAMEPDDLADVEVAERVARDDDERLVEQLLRVAHRSGGAEGLLLDRVLDAYAQGAAVAQVAADHLRHEGERHDDVVDPVLVHELDDVLDARLAADRHHRLGLVGGQRP